MKILSLLIAALMFVGIAPCYASTSFMQRPGMSDSKERKLETKKPKKTKKSKKSNKIKDRHSDRDEKHGKSDEQTDPLQGLKGEKGDKGDKGDSFPIAYGHFYTLSNGTIEQNESVMFTIPSTEAGGVALDTAQGAVLIPESGDYLISFHMHVKGTGVPAFGIRVNNSTLIPGSVFRGQAVQNRITQISGTLIATFAAGETFSIVNMSNAPFHFNNAELAESPNACVTIRKLN